MQDDVVCYVSGAVRLSKLSTVIPTSAELCMTSHSTTAFVPTVSAAAKVSSSAHMSANLSVEAEYNITVETEWTMPSESELTSDSLGKLYRSVVQRLCELSR